MDRPAIGSISLFFSSFATAECAASPLSNVKFELVAPGYTLSFSAGLVLVDASPRRHMKCCESFDSFLCRDVQVLRLFDVSLGERVASLAPPVPQFRRGRRVSAQRDGPADEIIHIRDGVGGAGLGLQTRTLRTGFPL